MSKLSKIFDMTTIDKKCHHLHQDLQTAIFLLRRDIVYHFLKILLSAIIIFILIKYANNFKIDIQLELTFENIIAVLTFFLELKIFSDLNDSFKKLHKLKILRNEIIKDYPGNSPNTCESDTCYMMKRVMEGTLS